VKSRPDSLGTTAEPLARLLKATELIICSREHLQCGAPSQATTHGRRVEKSGPCLEFNFLGRLAIILAFVLIQFLVGLRV
jgi:hypothetical protein